MAQNGQRMAQGVDVGPHLDECGLDPYVMQAILLHRALNPVEE